MELKNKKKLRRINREEREKIISQYLDGKSMRDISKSVNVPEYTVKYHVQKYKQREQENFEIWMNHDYRPRASLEEMMSNRYVRILLYLSLHEGKAKYNEILQCVNRESLIHLLQDLRRKGLVEYHNKKKYLLTNEGKKMAVSVLSYLEESISLTSRDIDI